MRQADGLSIESPVVPVPDPFLGQEAGAGGVKQQQQLDDDMVRLRSTPT